VSVNIGGSWGWATINRNGNATALPAWFGQSITQGHVVKMGASAPEWGAAPAPSAHAASHQDGGTDELALDGSQITTGTVGVARLATSGTASGATFLNGLGAWARPTAVWTRLGFNDADYDIGASFAFSCFVVQVGTLTATRTVTLPSTASFAAGQQVVVWSGAGVSATNRLVIAPVSGQTINGAATFEITQPNRLVRIMSNRNATSATNPNWVVQTADVDAADITTGTVNIARLPTGTTSTTVAVGNDSRFSDARTPTAHAASHQDGGTDELALDGSQITTGTVGTARLGSGSATASTFLRGDGSWATPGGTGDVVGPASSVDNRVALFDGTTGKLLKQSAAALASVATSGSASDLSAGTVPTARLSTKVLGGQDEGSIVTATTATSLLDSTITVSGAAGDLIEVVAGYRFLNSSGTTKAPTITLKLGTTTVLTYTPSAQSSSATDRQGHFRAAIRLESTTDQNVSGLGFIASGMTALTGTSTENLGTGVALDLTGAVQSGGSQEVQLHFVTITRVAA
jgi:hypothetical protein